MADLSHIVPVSAATIGSMDGGRFGAEVDRQIAILIRDIMDRPCDTANKTQPRKLKIQLTLTPVVQTDNGVTNLVQITAEPQLTGSCPAVVGMETEVQIHDGKACFNTICPGKFHQLPLPDPDSVDQQE